MPDVLHIVNDTACCCFVPQVLTFAQCFGRAGIVRIVLIEHAVFIHQTERVAKYQFAVVRRIILNDDLYYHRVDPVIISNFCVDSSSKLDLIDERLVLRQEHKVHDVHIEIVVRYRNFLQLLDTIIVETLRLILNVCVVHIVCDGVVVVSISSSVGVALQLCQLLLCKVFLKREGFVDGKLLVGNTLHLCFLCVHLGLFCVNLCLFGVDLVCNIAKRLISFNSHRPYLFQSVKVSL